MIMDAAKYFLQHYFLKICLAVAIIFAVIAFSALLTFTLIFYYHFDPILPLSLLILFWLMMMGVMYGYCYVAHKKKEAEIEKIYNRINIFLTLANVVKGLFTKKK
jgi:hypothetical protein